MNKELACSTLDLGSLFGQGEALDKKDELVTPLLAYKADILKDREFLFHSSMKEDYRWLHEILKYTKHTKNPGSRWTWRGCREEIREDRAGVILATESQTEEWEKAKKALLDGRKVAKKRDDHPGEKRMTEELKGHRGTPRSLCSFLKLVSDVM